MRLSELNIGDTCIFNKNEDPVFRTKMLEMGITQGTLLRMSMKAPFGGPIAFEFDNTTLSIRLEDADEIIIDPIKEIDS